MLFSCFFLILFLNHAQADDKGDKELNGGGGVACQQPDGSTTVQVLDLYLAEQKGAQIVRFHTVQIGQNHSHPKQGKQKQDWLEDYVLDRFSELNPELSLNFENTLREVQSIWKWSDRPVPVPTDLGNTTLELESNCHLVGLANFDDTAGQLVYDSKYVPMLDAVHRFALDAHEALSLLQRRSLADFQDTTKVMLTIGRVFSGKIMDSPIGDFHHLSEKVRCKSSNEGLDFTAFIDHADTVLNFDQIPGFPVLEPTTARIRNRRLIRDLEHGSLFVAQTKATSEYWPDFNLKLNYGNDSIYVHFVQDDYVVKTVEVSCFFETQ